jgi:tetratricopeptide (TPR) repeat protein
MLFTPQSCSLVLLDATLTEDRRELAQQLLDQIRSDVGRRTASHTLIVGPRGSGKTHLIAFVRKTCQASESGTSELLIMPLAEEEHGLTTLLDFLLAALRSCGYDLRALNPEFGTRGRDVAAADAITTFDQTVAGRAVLVLIENLSSVLSAMDDREVGRLRSFLQTHPRVSLLASSVELFTDSSHPDHPFYGFFSIQPLRPLNRKEARLYLAQLAGAKGDTKLESMIRSRAAKPRLDAIYDLTGGNHRLLAMLSTFLTVDGFAELVGPFVQMIDRELTPYYQQRLDRLSPQQKKILMAIADHHGRALTVKAIALYTFLTSQVVSRQLADLLHGAFVRRTALGRESHYELNEPLLRLVLDIKEGRDRPLPLIVAFLRRWYHVRELRHFEGFAPANLKAYYTAAIDQAIRPGESGTGEGRRRIMVERSRSISKGSRKHESREDPSSRFSRALAFEKQGLLDQAVKAYDDIVCSFGNDEQPELLHQVALALVKKGITLGQLNRSEEAIAVYDDVVRRFGSSENAELLEQVAWALVNKVITLGELNRSEEAIAVYDNVVRRFGSSENAELLEQVAMALVNKGITLGQLNRSEEAIAVYDDVVRRFGSSENADLLMQVAMALVNKGITLGQLNRSEEEIAVYDDLVRRFGSSENAELLEQVAMALVNKGITLSQLNRSKEAMAVYDEVVRSFSADAMLTVPVAKALAAKASLELEAGNFSESVALSERALFFVAGYPSAVQMRLRATFRAGKLLEGFQILRDFLSEINRTDPLRSSLVTLVLEENHGKDVALRELVDLYHETPDSLSMGFIGWVQKLLPMSEAKAKALESTEQVLKDLFGQVPTWSLALDLFTAVRHHAMGDRRALLDLPLEIRRLLPQEPE